MARRATPKQDRRTGRGGDGDGNIGADPVPRPPGETGRYLVLFRREAVNQGVENLRQVAGFSVASTADFEGGIPSEGLDGADALMFPDLGVAVVEAPPEQTHALGVSEASGVMVIEREREVYAIGGGFADELSAAAGTASLPLDYLRGYRDAVNELYERIAAGAAAEPGAEVALQFKEDEVTWGLQAVRVPPCRFTGNGIRVAVLDTGIDLGHPDFAGRAITSASFVQGEAVQDQHGHGTHCIGTACGPLRPAQLPRYGVAHDAEILAGKVLSNAGRGSDSGILAGIQWAMANQCQVVSMSLGAPVQLNHAYSEVFEHVARRALMAKTLIIAAAGNDSQRSRRIAPVSHPANCPSIMAVAAVDRALRVARFSNGGLNPQGGQVDIAGPGVDVRSTWPRPQLYNTIDGTSMATPHVAGVAALYAEAHDDFRGRFLMSILTQYARRLGGSARDVGAGLVQAPG